MLYQRKSGHETLILVSEVISISMHYLFSFEENSFLYNIDIQSLKIMYEVALKFDLFVLSKFEIIMIHCYG